MGSPVDLAQKAMDTSQLEGTRAEACDQDTRVSKACSSLSVPLYAGTARGKTDAVMRGGRLPTRRAGGSRGLKTGLREQWSASQSLVVLVIQGRSSLWWSCWGRSGIPQGLAVPQGLAHPLQRGHRAPSGTSSARPCAAAFLVLTLKDPSPRLERG